MPSSTVERAEAVNKGHDTPPSQSRRLPLELLVAIADQLRSHQDIAAFGLTCKDLYALLVKKQRRSLELYFEGDYAACDTMGAVEYRLLNPQAAMLAFSCREDELIMPWHSHRAFCCYEKDRNLADRLLSEHDYKLAKGVKELILSGYFPDRCSPGYTMDFPPFMRSSSFKAIRPEIFEVKSQWYDWDLRILRVMSMTNLKVLKVPLCLSKDCARLGRALTTMPRLMSLAIAYMPNQERFLKGLKFIGKGIMSCASTLRELDLEMTNYHRVSTWNEDDHDLLTEPHELGFCFRKIFPCPSEKKRLALSERHRQQNTDSVVEVPLCLTKLRLKHLSLPWYSFDTIFNAETIKNLHLPCSSVDIQLWGLLANAQLDTLTDISYDMLSTPFLGFLSQQSSLKELTFAPPPMHPWWDNDLRTILDFARDAPRLGPHTRAGYPSLDTFLISLKDMKRLKHLVLPTDMYGISCECFFFFAEFLTGLEHLELGFDYNDLELQGVFELHFLHNTPSLKKITFLSRKQPRPLPDFDSAHLHALFVSLGSKVPQNLKLLRYITMNRERRDQTEMYYHRQTPIEGDWWMRLPQYDCEQAFKEGRTPRIVPVGKWDWETEVTEKRRASGKLVKE